MWKIDEDTTKRSELFNQIYDVLQRRQSVAVPEEFIQKAGFTLEGLRHFFYVSKGEYGDWHFMGIKKMI